MATDIDHHALTPTIVRLRATIEYQIFFLVVIFCIGVILSIHIISSIQDLKVSLSEVGARITVIQKDIDVMKSHVDVNEKRY